MANKRTVYDIAADTWVKIIDGETAAKIYNKKTDVSYHSFAGTSSGDTPSGTIINTPTSEKMFTEKGSEYNEILADSLAVYLWVRCGVGEVGKLIVTL